MKFFEIFFYNSNILINLFILPWWKTLIKSIFYLKFKYKLYQQVKKIVGLHIGTYPEIQEQYKEGTLDVEFIPMGTIVECIRAGGSGLGAFITATALGTEIEKWRDKLTVYGNNIWFFR